jgi:5-methylcytosine-specific restriction endonuclease McrA
MHLSFEFPEDEQYFAKVLAGGDVLKLSQFYGHLFDFRSVEVKSWEFKDLYIQLKGLLMERLGSECQLKLLPQCSGGIVVDHLIPRASNVLNKELRGLSANPGEKVPSQSFGSNHIDNLVLACEACNRKKFNQLPTRECEWVRIITRLADKSNS